MKRLLPILLLCMSTLLSGSFIVSGQESDTGHIVTMKKDADDNWIIQLTDDTDQYTFTITSEQCWQISPELDRVVISDNQMPQQIDVFDIKTEALIRSIPWQ